MRVEIIDYKPRGRALEETLKRHIPDAQVWRVEYLNPGLHEHRDCDLALFHLGNSLREEYIKKIGNEYQIPVVGYTAGGENAIGSALSPYYSVWPRPVDSGNETDFLNAINRICNLIERRRRECLSDEKFLEEVGSIVSPVGVQYLSALSILCQGFLAAHSENSLSQQEVDSALREMEWNRIKEGRLIQAIRDKASETERPSWWRDVFSLEKLALENTLKSEWQRDLPKPVSRLVAAFFRDKPLKNASLIASAYLEIAHKLKG